VNVDVFQSKLFSRAGDTHHKNVILLEGYKQFSACAKQNNGIFQIPDYANIHMYRSLYSYLTAYSYKMRTNSKFRENSLAEF